MYHESIVRNSFNLLVCQFLRQYVCGGCGEYDINVSGVKRHVKHGCVGGGGGGEGMFRILPTVAFDY